MDQVKSLTAFVYFDFQYQDPDYPGADIWCSKHGVWQTKEEALAAAVEYQQTTGQRTRLIQNELYRTVL